MMQAMRAVISRPGTNTIHTWLALAAGLALRLWMVAAFPDLDGDPQIYGSIARNWFFHGIYGITAHGHTHATLIRLPGYPFFLGLCFVLFGKGKYTGALLVQVIADLGTCLLISALARRLCGARAAGWALWLAVLCPFTASYTAAGLTETLELLTIALSFYAFIRLVEEHSPSDSGISARMWGWTLLLALSATYAALLRPDGPLAGVVLYPALLLYGLRNRRPSTGIHRGQSIRLLAVCLVITAIPFSLWTIRNWRTFHVFQPLAPRYANEPWQSSDPGWQRWISTVCADFTCTYDIYWNLNGTPLDFHQLPARAFDSPAQRQATRQLFEDYNRTEFLSPALDVRFGQLAAQRFHDHPWRYHVELPLLRLADMWLRPRTEMLPVSNRWWRYSDHPQETIFDWAYAGLNLALLIAAIFGLAKKPPYFWIIVAFIAARCALLLTLETPEPRYTLECFPLLLALAGMAFARCPTSRSSSSPARHES
jgi:4-amino-4-deoxy-L-arabinose transferase-like glycosyltransferase